MKTRASRVARTRPARPLRGIAAARDRGRRARRRPGRARCWCRVRAAGLCHSDLSVIDGNRPRPLPMVLGHETAGVVEETRARRHRPAARRPRRDLVRAELRRTARPCVAGRPALCEPGARRQHRRHAAVAARAGCASTASRCTITSASRRSPSGRPCRAARWCGSTRRCRSREAALFGCAVITGVGAVVNTADDAAASTRRGDRPRRRRPRRAARRGACCDAHAIVAVDLSQHKLAHGARTRRHAHRQRRRRRRASRRIREATRRRRRLRVRDGRLGQARWNSRTRSRAAAAPRSPPACRTRSSGVVPHVSLVAEERTLKGSYLGSCVPSRDIPRYIEWYRRAGCRSTACCPSARARRHQRRLRPPRRRRVDPAGGRDWLSSPAA